MNNIIEKLKHLVEKYPENATIMGNFSKLAEEHPEWNKISDFPPFSAFPAIEWENDEISKIILDSAIKTMAKGMNNYFTNISKGTEMGFVIGLIRDFALCKCAANALQAKFDIEADPRYQEEKFKQSVYSQTANKN
jgi:hypothetical protein